MIKKYIAIYSKQVAFREIRHSYFYSQQSKKLRCNRLLQSFLMKVWIKRTSIITEKLFGLSIILMLGFFSSCVAVKGYEKISINDPDMALADKKSNRNVSTFHSYREAAVGANGGKTGGGCGCN